MCVCVILFTCPHTCLITFALVMSLVNKITPLRVRCVVFSCVGGGCTARARYFRTRQCPFGTDTVGQAM